MRVFSSAGRDNKEFYEPSLAIKSWRRHIIGFFSVQTLHNCSSTALRLQPFFPTYWICVFRLWEETSMQTADRPTSLKLNPETYPCLVKSEQINRVKFGSSHNSHNKIICADNQLLHWTPPRFSEKRNQISPDTLKPQPEYINIFVISAPWCRYQTVIQQLSLTLWPYTSTFSLLLQLQIIWHITLKSSGCISASHQRHIDSPSLLFTDTTLRKHKSDFHQKTCHPFQRILGSRFV